MTHTHSLVKLHVLSAELTRDVRGARMEADWEEAPVTTQARDGTGDTQGRGWVRSGGTKTTRGDRDIWPESRGERDTLFPSGARGEEEACRYRRCERCGFSP